MKMKKSAATAAMTPNGKKSAATPAAMQSTPPTPTPTPAPVAAKPVKAAAAAPTTKAASPAPATNGAVTTIEVKLDVGFGNAVFLRGNGGGLTWDRGVQLSCVDGKIWRWSATVKDPITFKPLINDKIWSAGTDLTVKPGQKVEVQPSFS